MQNLGRKLKGVRGRGLKPYENGPQKRFVFYFRHLLRRFKIVTYVMSYTGYTSLVKILLQFDLIKAHLSSFRLFSAYLGLLI